MTDDSASAGRDPGAAGGAAHGPGPARPAGATRHDVADGDGPGRARPRLRRGHGEEKVLAGVCHGAGRYFDVDPVIFRVVLVVLSLTGGIGLIVYGMGWLVVPQEGEEQSEAHRLLSGRIEGAPLTAVLMALVGCGLYASMLGNAANQAFSLLLLAATAGAAYWSQQRARLQSAGETAPSRAGASSAAADAPPAAQAPPSPGGSPSWWREPITKEPPYLWGPDDGPYGEQDARAWRERKKTVRRDGSWVFGLVVFLLAGSALAVGTGVSWDRRPLGSSLEIGLSGTLAVLGLAFVVASFAGRARGGTVFWALVTTVALVGAAALPKSGHGVGTTHWRPLTASAVQPRYERGAGTADLDLSALVLTGGPVRTELRMGAGKAVLRLPQNAVVHLDYSVDAGKVLLPGQEHSGVHVRNARHRQVSYAPAAGTASTGTVDVDVDVVAGQLEVVR